MRIAASFLLAAIAVAPALAAPPDTATIVSKMRGALEPDRASVRKLTMTVTGPGGDASQITLGAARKRVGAAPRVVMVVLAPEGLRGTSLLVEEASDQNVLWLYVPAIGRVRKLVSPEAYTTFLNSDFTFADLGFVGMGAKYELAGEEKRQGADTYKLEAVPRETWYYARFLTWVAKDTFFPVERDFNDVANNLWKVQRWSNVSTINGVPTALRLSMENVQTQTKSEIVSDAVRYDVDVPDALVDPGQLSTAPASAVWGSLATK
jgi:hypothetical protein